MVREINYNNNNSNHNNNRLFNDRQINKIDII